MTDRTITRKQHDDIIVHVLKWLDDDKSDVFDDKSDVADDNNFDKGEDIEQTHPQVY